MADFSRFLAIAELFLHPNTGGMLIQTASTQTTAIFGATLK